MKIEIPETIGAEWVIVFILIIGAIITNRMGDGPDGWMLISTLLWSITIVSVIIAITF